MSSDSCVDHAGDDRDTALMSFGTFIFGIRRGRALTQEEFGDIVGYSRQQINNWEKGRHMPPSKMLARIAAKLGIDEKTVRRAAAGVLPLDTDQPESLNDNSDRWEEMKMASAPPTFDEQKQMPVFANAEGGKGVSIVNPDPIAWVDRPEPLANVKNAYAVYVIGDSMEPKYTRGQLLFINPDKPAAAGDFVLVVRNSTHRTETDAFEAMVKQFIRRDDNHLVLRQFNPAEEISIPMADVHALHPITLAFER